MTLFAIVYKAGLKAWLNTGNDAFVDVAFALFTTGNLNIQVDQFLTVDDGYA